MAIINEFNNMATALNKQDHNPWNVSAIPWFILNLMCKNNNLEETIIQCIYLNWVYIASVIRSALIDGASSQINARNNLFWLGLADVRVGNYIY